MNKNPLTINRFPSFPILNGLNLLNSFVAKYEYFTILVASHPKSCKILPYVRKNKQKLFRVWLVLE